jgi:hypothetical protein
MAIEKIKKLRMYIKINVHIFLLQNCRTSIKKNIRLTIINLKPLRTPEKDLIKSKLWENI